MCVIHKFLSRGSKRDDGLGVDGSVSETFDSSLVVARQHDMKLLA